MHILVDTRHLTQQKQAGVGEYTFEILRALFSLDQKNSYTLLSAGREEPGNPLQILDKLFTHKNNIKRVHLNERNKSLSIKSLLFKKPIFSDLIANKPDLLFLPNLNFTNIPRDIPTVLTIHDLSWKLFPECYSKKMKLWHKAVKPNELIKNSSKIICPSNSTKNDIKNIFQKDDSQISVIPHGINPDFTNQMRAQDHGVRSRLKLPKKFVLFVGTLEPRKNILSTIEGIKRYREKHHDDIHLVLAGSFGWKSRSIKKQLLKKEIKPWVHHIGYVKRDERPALYRSAQALVWPSLYEGFGLPILESMASGTPVITSHTSSMPEITESAAVLVDPYNVNDITGALHGLLGSNMLKSQLKNQGLIQAQKYNWEKSAKMLLNEFNSLVK
jgi:glycosyltransferase involved in cell wall biosynthesis